MPTGKYTSADVATPETQAQTSAPEQQEGNSLQRSFDENTKVTAGEPKFQSFLKGTVSGVGSPFIHPIETAKGMVKDLALPATGTSMEDIQNSMPAEGEGGNQGAAAAGSLLGSGLVGGAAGEMGGAALEKIPTRAKAGAIFNDLNTKLANQPVSLTNSTPQLEQLEKIGATGPSAPSTVNKLIDRSRAMYPMNYPEARLFQENLASPSITEKEGMGGSMKGGVKQLNKAFYNDIHGAADAAGLGEDYANAMKQYHQAAMLNHAFKTAGKAAAIGAVGAGGVKLAKDLIP